MTKKGTRHSRVLFEYPVPVDILRIQVNKSKNETRFILQVLEDMV